MKAIVLAAGRGSRMGIGTETSPKCMMKLFGKTLLEHCLCALCNAGFNKNDIGIVTGYKSEMIQEQVIHYFHNPDWESTNMFVSLTKAAKWLRAEPCIVSYSDIIFSPKAVKKLVESEHDFTITYYTGFWELWNKRFDNPLDDLESFKLLGDRLIEIGNKPISKEDVQGQYMGLLKFNPAGWAIVERSIEILPRAKTVEELDMTTLLQHLITLGYYIKAVETAELWLECDNQNDINVYETYYPQIQN